MNGSATDKNVTGVVPLLNLRDMETSVRYYVDGLGFTMKNKWVVDEKLRWCWLALGGASLMIQWDGRLSPAATVGEGVSLCFQCEDAIRIYHQFRSRGIQASEPEVGNALGDFACRSGRVSP